DPRLGPEMKSTGEVMGTASSVGRAYGKAQLAIGKPVPTEGTAVVDLADDEFPAPESVPGRALRNRVAAHFDVVSFDDEAAFCDAIRAGEVDLIISRAREPLTVAVEEGVTYFSTYPSALAALQAVEASREPLDVRALSDRPAYHERWGQPKDA
ncbi:MAG: carbamoyl-phosphate synthase large subunit, partial [Halobacteriales archaeon]